MFFRNYSVIPIFAATLSSLFVACQKSDNVDADIAAAHGADSLSAKEMKAAVNEATRDISDYFRSDDVTIPKKNFKTYKTLEFSRNTNGSLSSVKLETRLYAPWNNGSDWAYTICITTHTVSVEKKLSLEDIECEIFEQ